MERELLELLAGKRRVQRQEYELRILSAWELMQARQEAEELNGGKDTAALRGNACILRRAVVRGNTQMFSSGAEVLATWSAEKIADEMRAYRSLASRVAPDCGQENRVRELMEELEQEPMERIRWKVLKTFGVLPSEKRAREMTEGDYLYCVLQMMLDREETLERLCPTCRSRAEQRRCSCCGRELTQEQEVNPQFDEKRFEEMKHGG